MGTQLRNAIAFTSLFASLPGVAQFNVLPVGNALWVDASWIGPGYPYTGWAYSMDASAPDTIIDGIAYEHLIGGVGGFAIRDNLQGQVYFRSQWEPGEHLLYDFDVNVGDTIWYDATFLFFFDSLEVVSVDTINLAGIDRKRIGVTLDFGSNWAIQYWIQGIGSDGGLFNPCQGPSVSGTSWLSCMSEDGITQFGSNPGQQGNCLDALSTTTLDGAETDIDVWPNPGSGSLTITSHFGQASQVRVFDMQGRTVGTWNLSGEKLVLLTEAWTSGIYVVEVSSEGSAPAAIKWVHE